jgi:hypothetical protein
MIMKHHCRLAPAVLFCVYFMSLLLCCGSFSAFAWTPGKQLTISYPRLGMWWPDPWEQSLDDIARYDYVLLSDEQEDFIAPLKARNPDILQLNSTNACELSYDWPDSTDYAEILKIPPEWFLTQVGSTLTQAVDATATTFHVASITVTDGTTSYPLFVSGDTALIDGESVVVEAVNKAAKTLTVQRGFVRPASSHPAGTRIAAHITFWPGSWLLNLSMMSPVGIADPAKAPERWADYNARRAAQLLSNPEWDGILVDRADPNQSWLIGGSTARTIDPDQSNTLITDYSAFDASWNEGLRHYESRLRQMAGDGKIILVNWGMDNYDLLNGNNYEGFPQPDGSSYNADWHNTVFGPVSNIGDYLNWLDQARQPNLTTVETYEDDSSPPPDDIGYDNPCAKPGFKPNYRKMRFGLTTALLGNGFYSYEINTNGHGSLCLMWFDEYDNAGKERGYLGQPLGPAYRVAGIELGPNLLSGGDFETQADLDTWGLWADSGYAATLSRDTGDVPSGASAARIDVIETGGTDWKVSLSYEPITLAAKKNYTISFWARADRERPISVWAQQGSAPWETYFSVDEIMLDTTWKRHEISVASSATDRRAQFIFGLGQAEGTVFIDDAQLQAGSREVWRRDYSGGIALVNATVETRHVDLGATFRKIAGTQAPKINDGSLVTRVTLPPHDGLILLRADIPPSTVDPDQGTIGTKFKLTGSGFGKKPRVYAEYLHPRNGKIKRKYAKVLKKSAYTIEALWKKVLAPGTYDLFVLPKGRGASPIAMGSFSIMAPVIDGGISLSGVAGETVTITGWFFTTQKPRVYLENPNSSRRKRCNVRASNMDPASGQSSLKFKVPKLNPGTYNFILKTKIDEASTTFTIN